MTTGAAANPTLTIVALALRQADHIEEQLKAGALTACHWSVASHGQLTRISPSSDQPSCSTVWLTICGVSTR